MAKRGPKKKVCKCGAKIRPQAVFCYNCGTELVPTKAVEQVKAEVENAVIAVIDDPPPIPVPDIALKDFAEPQMAPMPEEPKVPANVNATVEKGSAPRKQRRERPPRPRPAVVNVEWAEPSGMGAGFLLWTFVFIVICALVIAIAIYLK